MKTTKQSWLVLLAVAGSLLLAAGATARETNVVPEPQAAAPTNNLPGGTSPAEMTDAGTNAPRLAAVADDKQGRDGQPQV